MGEGVGGEREHEYEYNGQRWTPRDARAGFREDPIMYETSTYSHGDEVNYLYTTHRDGYRMCLSLVLVCL